jgi:calcineurin-like phosphoesterase family protein
MERFVISDTHFAHTNSWEKFKREDGTPLRPFTSTEEMDETMIERWNARVGPNDTVYHCGDVAINKKGLASVSRLNGRKILVRGNHDIFKDEQYREVGFEQIHGVRVWVDRYIFSHIPLHPDCVTDRFRVNVHGHLHANQVMRSVKDTDYVIGTTFDGSKIYNTKDEPDPRYFCASVERVNYTPMSFDELDIEIERRFHQFGYEPPKGYFNGSGAS